MALIQETKPNIKNNTPMMAIEILSVAWSMIPLERWWFGSCYWVLEVVNKEADALSKYNSQLACCCKMLAGNRLLTSFSTQFFTASAFLWSGIEQMMCLDFMICRIDMLIACNGTSSKVLNQPSFSCCSRHALSKFT